MRLNEFSKEELKEMHEAGTIDWCPVCKRYHVADKPKFPLSNIWICDECKKERVKENE